MERNVEKLKTPFQGNLKKFMTNKLAVTGLVVLVALLLFAIVGPYVTGYDEETIDMMNMLAKPGNGHTLGTDELGRDILTRLAYGGRVSISVGIFATLMELLIGVLLGSIAGLYGGIVESVIMRITDIIMCFPFFVIALSIAAITGPSFRNLIFIIGILGWPSVCRIVRSKVLYLKNMEYVEAARSLGLGQMEIIFRHILPNSLGPIITTMMIAVPQAIFTESFLAYIGLGLKAPEPSIGVLLSEGQKVLLNFPYQSLFPGIVISALMISFNLFGNGLRDAMDPTLRGT